LAGDTWMKNNNNKKIYILTQKKILIAFYYTGWFTEITIDNKRI